MKCNCSSRTIIPVLVFTGLMISGLWFWGPDKSSQTAPAIKPSTNGVAGNAIKPGASSANGMPVISQNNFPVATNSPATIPSPGTNETKTSASSGDGQISASALKQIAALEAEKSRWTPTQQKIGSQLLCAGKMQRGEPVAEGVPTLRLNLDRDGQGRVLVDIKAEVTQTLLKNIADLGGSVINSYPEYHAIQAGVPLSEIENLAAQKEVAFIRPVVHSMRNTARSEGDQTHQADMTRTSFAVNGTGVKVGVISDSVDYLSGSQLDGRVTVLTGQSGMPGSGEGTAMLEIVNDLAPGAKLYFATCGTSEAQFAANIRSLRANGCDIIVDDIMFFDESPFQDGVVAWAVNDVTAGGALYFSAAGNAGNQDEGTSGTWEGDFVDSGVVNDPRLPANSGRVHSFGGALYDTASAGSYSGVNLFWADPWGASANDYDVYVLDSTGSQVVDASIDLQNGTQDPYEYCSSLNSGELIVIVKYSGLGRFLHLSTEDGELAISTPGSTRGHSCAANAFGVAATDAYNSYPYSFTGGSTNPVEEYSSDGPRRVFFQANGTAITPGNFSVTGGTLRSKPDITAADDVTTAVPGFAPFRGTSAAAPHAAAIAALLKSSSPNLTASQIRGILTNTAMDIMSPGPDRDAGAGIVMALAAVEAAPHPDLTRRTDSLSNLSPHNGDVVTASLTITNQTCSGGSANAGAFHVGFYGLSASTNFTGLLPFKELAVNGCAARSTVSATLNIPIDPATTPGIYYLGYKIDDENEVPECNDENNGLNCWTVTVIPETNQPTVHIISPTSGQRWSNGIFTVSGTAGDNAAVANVFCSLDGVSWTAASTTNRWTNWTSQVALAPGTNTVAAYAVDTSGNISPTNRVNFQNVVTNQLQIQAIGLGTISPNYSNAWLEIGRNYSMTATPGSGFKFASWTGSQTTNGATLAFQMTPGLTFTANFTDTTRPVLSITNLAAGQRVSSEVYTARGTAGDNWQMSNVFYRLNGGQWSNATTANNWTNWAGVVNLIPGTNTVAAYAVDATGNFSLTNSVSFQFVLTNQLQIQAIGLGTISPNYSNAWLEIGRNYTIAATPAAGFIVTNWTVATNWIGGRITNSATVQFNMASNLTLQASFADVMKPTSSITNLTAGQRVTNAMIAIMGKANDNWAVSNVWYQLNGMGWTNAATANGWCNWSAVVTLFPGTNIVQAFATDTSGNTSLTNSLSFQFVVTNRLQIQAIGLGTISPNYSNAWLEIGRNYTVTATPAAGFVATNWTVATNWIGGRITNSATIQFNMASNLTLQASFADVTKPTLSITVPTSGQKMTNALAKVKGVANDNWGVTQVWYQLNSGSWNPATSTNGWTNWTVTLTLVAGTNTVRAYAMDFDANLSATNSVSFISSNSFQLQLDFPAAQPLASNGLNFSLQTSPGLNGLIQVSSDLISWATLTNFVGTNATINFVDPAATNYNRRFYRAVVP